jgi:hypothetical protein
VLRLYIRSAHARLCFHEETLFQIDQYNSVDGRFLDFHGAKNNKTGIIYRELTAAVRHLSLGAYSQKHITNRLVFYDIPDFDEFREQGEKTLDFLNDCLRRLAPVDHFRSLSPDDPHAR